MGLMDFFRKGKEKPVAAPQPQTRTTSPTPSPSAQNVPKPGAQTQRDYTIQSGDSLSKIAKQFYGDAKDWDKIYQANKDKIKDPNMIYPGQKIIIP
jgi:nucleoid-associated protein YgaU